MFVNQVHSVKQFIFLIAVCQSSTQWNTHIYLPHQMSVATVISLGPRIGQLLLGLGDAACNIHFLEVPVSSFNLLIQLISIFPIFFKIVQHKKIPLHAKWYHGMSTSFNFYYELYSTCTYMVSGSHLFYRG